MEYFVICLAALIASCLTLFSGFGLGTILMPVFAIFYPVEIAVAITAAVHFLNNLFKLVLVGRYTDGGVVLRFGIPAIVFAFLGAKALIHLSALKPLAAYHLFGKPLSVTPVNLSIAVLLVIFSVAELMPQISRFSIERKYLPLGGILSGFFGGLSGNQGALRSAFLVKAGLSRESYIATGVVIACLVDATRLGVYGSLFLRAGENGNSPLLIAATISAFLGAFIGSRLMKKATMRAIQILVVIMLLTIATALGLGVL